MSFGDFRYHSEMYINILCWFKYQNLKFYFGILLVNFKF